MAKKLTILYSLLAYLLFVTYPASDVKACMGLGIQDVLYIPPPENQLYFAENIDELLSIVYPNYQLDKNAENTYSVKLPNKVENPAVATVSFYVDSLNKEPAPITVDLYASTKVHFTENSEYPDVQLKSAFFRIASYKLSAEFGGELHFRMRGSDFGKPRIYAVIRKTHQPSKSNVMISLVQSNIPELWHVCGSTTAVVYTHNKALQATLKSGAPEF